MNRIIIIEDQTILLDSLARAINSTEDLEVCATSNSAAAAASLASDTGADLVLMDICTEGGASGLEAARILRESHPDLRIVLMTAMPDLSFIEEARLIGVDSFVYKNISTEKLISIIRSTLDSYQTFPPSPEVPILGYNTLTDREITVLRLVCAGMARTEIAQVIDRSENTVKKLITSILAKTGYTSITRLALYLLSSGFIVLNREPQSS